MEQIFAKFFSPEKLINGIDLVTAPPIAIKKITLKKVINGIDILQDFIIL